MGVSATIAHLQSSSSQSPTSTSNLLVASEPLGGVPYPPYRIPRPVASPTPIPASPVPAPAAAPAPAAHAPAAPAPSAPRRSAPPARIVIGSTQQVLINQDRARYGLAPLTWNSCLASVAASNAARMAAAEVMSHANGVYQDLACGIGHQSGENIGWYSAGVNDSVLNTDFMNSPEHKANILGPFHYVATAWRVAANGVAYIAVEFD
jgi:uncharacterized protein YkwD